MKTIGQWVRAGVCSACGLIGSTIAPRAQAKGLAGATELQLKTTVFEYQSTKGTGLIDVSPGAVMLGPDSTNRTSASFGLMGSGYGAQIGHYLNDHVQLGAGLQVTHAHSSTLGYTNSSNATSLAIAPRVEYAFGAGVLRPYLAGFGGYTRLWASNTNSVFRGEYDGSGFFFGGGLGAHVFLGDSWSLDPELSVGRESRTGTTSMIGAGDAGARYDYDNTVRATSLMLSVGLSGWVGG